MATPTLPQFVNGGKPSPKPVRLSGLGRGIGLAAFKPAGAGRPEGGRGRGASKLSRLVTEAVRHLGTVRNYSPVTLDNYQTSFDQFHQFLYSHGRPDDVQQFTGDNVQRFAESLAAKKQKASTVVIRLNGLSTIANTLMKLKDARGRAYLTENPTRTFEWPTVDRTETQFLLPDELKAFLAVARPLRESIPRDLLVDTGLRVSELCRANVSDIITVDGHTSLALTVKGRGRRVRKRHVPVSADVASVLFEYLTERGIPNPQDARHREAPLVLSSEGCRWKRTGLSALTWRTSRDADIDRFRVSAHKLRHTANVVARLARRDDGTTLDRWTRSRLLTHENPQSIDRYEHLLPDELSEAREAQRRALSRYLGDGTHGTAVDRRPARAGGELDPSAVWDRLDALGKQVAALVATLGSGANGAVVEH